MKTNQLIRLALVAIAACGMLPAKVAAEDPLLVGAETEKRFPPLTLPSGFQARLWACDPLVEYPSVIALGTRRGSLFVAHDYLTGLGTEITRRDEIRLVEDTDCDGYADKSTVFAGGFHSIQGLAYHAGTVFAMHSPLLTALVDTDGDGVADERRDLLGGLGLPPEENPPRLHCANGVVAGHDGWLYLALGDHGCNVLRGEGDRLVLEGGGILRCRPDGGDLHVFATGLRNVYDVALDEALNVFVRDNENDGGDYKIRVCHSFFGADHGYPYLYDERPEEAMPPLADLGLGSSAGGVCYLETALPGEYRGNLFFCEWGRAVVRFPLEKRQSSFASRDEVQFAAGAASDPYGFKPTDLVVDRDGSMLVSDWADGQRPKRGRARIYRISCVQPPGERQPSNNTSPSSGSALDQSIAQLDSQSYYARLAAQTAVEQQGDDGITRLLRAVDDGRLGVPGRLHAVWLIARCGRGDSTDRLFSWARSDPHPQIRAQAIRALADLTDPVLVHRRLDAGRGDADVAAQIAALAEDADPLVMLEAVIALGRLRWSQAPSWLREHLKKQPDSALAHAAMQTLRRSENWPAVLKLLDEPLDAPVRTAALRALADRRDAVAVDGLIDRLHRPGDSRRMGQYADLLTRVYKRPGPWVYWGYRPEPRPAATVDWERTAAIEQALNHVLTTADTPVRTATLCRAQREEIPVPLATLTRWLRQERDERSVAAILDSLAKHPADQVRRHLADIVGQTAHATPNRLQALASLVAGLDADSEKELLELVPAIDDDVVLAELLRWLGEHPDLRAGELLIGKLNSRDAGVRAAAITSLARLRIGDAASRVPALLADKDAGVRRAAALAAGDLSVPQTIEPLLKLVRDDRPEVVGACLESLRRLGEPRAVAAAEAALDHRETQLAALDYLEQLGGPAQRDAVERTARENRSMEVLSRAVRSLTAWKRRATAGSTDRDRLDRAVARLQGDSGALLWWTASGPLREDVATRFLKQSPPNHFAALNAARAEFDWNPLLAKGLDARVDLGRAESDKTPAAWLAYCDLVVSEASSVEFLSSSSGTLQVWLDGDLVYTRQNSGAYQPDSDRFEAMLDKGAHRVFVLVTSADDAARFQVKFRLKGSTDEHERLTRAALNGGGNVRRGQGVFLDVEKSLCMKCHRLDGSGGLIGPELTGLGSRFSPIHLIESVLAPSRTIASSFQTIVVALNDGRLLAGIKIAETDTELTLGDNEGQIHKIARSDIDEQRVQSKSTMPDGLEKRFTEQEFLDLMAFLLSQKRVQEPGP